MMNITIIKNNNYLLKTDTNKLKKTNINIIISTSKTLSLLSKITF